MLYTASLNSGSNGNCYYVGNGEEAVLIDAGISCRETERRLKRLELSIHRIKAIFVTHEHADHIDGVARLSKKYQLPVYITEATLKESRLVIAESRLRSFRAHEPINVGNLTILPIPKFHDASDPHSFIVSGSGVHIGVFTDTGKPDKHLLSYFSQCHAAFLESNYDEQMLENGEYPLSLKNRIRNGSGHLSNNQALEVFVNHRPGFMSHLFLSHLSQHNNSPALVQELFSEISGSTEIIVASRYEESAVFTIQPAGPLRPLKLTVKPKPAIQQLSLFA